MINDFFKKFLTNHSIMDDYGLKYNHNFKNEIDKIKDEISELSKNIKQYLLILSDDLTLKNLLLEEFDYQNETLMVAPAAGFYSTEGEGNNQVRIAYVLNQDSLKRAIKCLEQALIQYPGLKR